MSRAGRWRLALRLAPLASCVWLFLCLSVVEHDANGSREYAAAREQLDALLVERLPRADQSEQEREDQRTRSARALERFAEALHWPPTLRSEAAFRAGELWRAAGDDRAALECFRRAREQGMGTRFRTRAILELGHVHRRAERWSLALDAYYELAHTADARASDRDAALYWSGVVCSELNQVAAARRAWRHVARNAERPLDRVRAYDKWALLEFNFGNPQVARDVLAVCDAELKAAALEDTTLGASVHAALMRMRSRTALAPRRRDDGGEESR